MRIIGNTVKDDPIRAETVAAPATVSEEEWRNNHWLKSWEGVPIR